MKVRAEAEGGGLFRYESAANMLEGGGKTPILNPMELEEIGWGFYTSNAESNSLYSIQRRDQVDKEQTSQSFKDPIVEVITPDDVYNKYGADSSRNPFSGIWSRTLRVKITGRDGFEKLDLRIPAGFLDGITNIVPALGGLNIKELLDDVTEEVGGKLLLDFQDRMGDRIQVFLE
ncbi:hypothetical protein JHK84_051867 [Glycine max]|nr:hypothetical protein JHK84_051867 [Glycine max]